MPKPYRPSFQRAPAPGRLHVHPIVARSVGLSPTYAPTPMTVATEPFALSPVERSARAWSVIGMILGFLLMAIVAPAFALWLPSSGVAFFGGIALILIFLNGSGLAARSYEMGRWHEPLSPRLPLIP